LLSRKLYTILTLACGIVLIDYGFNFLATGLPGAREFTSQFVGANLILGGSALVFASLYFLLRPVPVGPLGAPQPAVRAPDVGVETIVEEETGPKAGFYREISYVGYFFTVLGIFSAADLVLQVFLRSTYNETRWWVEILLVVFGVLSYTIFGSIGHLGYQEESSLKARPMEVSPTTQGSTQTEANIPSPQATYPETLEIRMADFTRTASGEFEKHLAGETYDLVRVEPEMVTIWRESRLGLRSIYLAGPYELSRAMLEGQLKRGEALRIGILNLPVDSIRDLLVLQSPVASSTTG
jgi:hypothetical protein